MRERSINIRKEVLSEIGILEKERRGEKKEEKKTKVLEIFEKNSGEVLIDKSQERKYIY